MNIESLTLDQLRSIIADFYGVPVNEVSDEECSIAHAKTIFKHIRKG